MPLPSFEGFATGTKYIIISALVASAMVGATAMKIKPYVDKGKATGAGQAAVCPSFNFTSWGDPHVKTEISGGASSQTDQMNDISSFTNVLNTVDGEVSTSTQVTSLANGVTINRQITITSKNYSVNVATSADGTISAMITNAAGSTVINPATPFAYLAPGKSPTGVDANGTPTGSMAYIDPTTGALDISIPLSSGGYFNSAIYRNDANGLDITQSGYGTTAIGGMAVAQVSNQDKNIIVMPCPDPEAGKPKPSVQLPPTSGATSTGGNTKSVTYQSGASL